MLVGGVLELVFRYISPGNRVEQDFDIRKAAGGRSFTAAQRTFKVNVSENYLEVHLFWAGNGTCCVPAQGSYGPMVSAISATPDFLGMDGDRTLSVMQNSRLQQMTSALLISSEKVDLVQCSREHCTMGELLQ